jgi:hypothetical protein
VAAVSLGNKEEIVYIFGIERGKDGALAGVRDRPRGKPLVEISIIGRPTLQVLQVTLVITL